MKLLSRGARRRRRGGPRITAPSLAAPSLKLRPARRLIQKNPRLAQPRAPGKALAASAVTDQAQLCGRLVLGEGASLNSRSVTPLEG
jgi:hypothetical protein